jgi:alkylated DNA repair protein alkB family protein 1
MTTNCFKQTQIKYRRDPKRPDHFDDLDELIDFSRNDPRTVRLDSLKDAPYQGPTYALSNNHGFLYCPGALSENCQLQIAWRAVSDYCEAPHATNIDLVQPKTTELINNHTHMWELWNNDTNCNDDANNKYYKCFEKLAWATMGYHYDWTARTYPKDCFSLIPDDLVQLANVFAATALLHTSDNDRNIEFYPSACIVNYYHSKSIMGGHCDDSEFALDKPIVSFSMGRPAVFLLGGPDKNDPVVPIFMRPGDVMLMGGESRLNVHAMARLLPAKGLPPVDPSRVATAKQQIATLGNFEIPNDERDKVQLFLNKHRININLRQVFCDKASNILTKR